MDVVATLDRDPRLPGDDVDVPSAPIGQLEFLYRIIRLATTAGTWDELLETVVDGTRDALQADVSSLYLLDRDGLQLTLAATNGLDRFQIGRARVPFGEGVTGYVAAQRESMIIPDVPAEPRFLWVRGIDQRRFIASMLSVPLIWHDTVVGVLNVQTEQPRDFTIADRDQLRAIADLLAGIVERVRLQREAEDQRRPAARPRPGARRADRPRDARAAHAAGGRARLCGPAGRGAAARRIAAREIPAGGPPGQPGTMRSWRRSSASIGWSIRSSPRSDRRADGAAARQSPGRPGDHRGRGAARSSPPASPSPARGPRRRASPRHRRRRSPSPGHRASRRERRQVRPTGIAISIETSLQEGVVRSRSRTTARVSRTIGANGSSSPTPAGRPGRRAARASDSMRLADCASRWAHACGASRDARAAHASSSRWPPWWPSR